MTSKEIRQQFLQFFQERGHTIVPSASVIPYDDPTLLFTNAGMNQFKDVFLGTGKREYVRSADSQKCIRVSGKHNDLEEVGRDTYHHTFFEMLGNWSFGDYYKKEAIEWAWELLTKVWRLDKKRLHATVFETDDEAEQLWKTVTDIEHSHIHRCGKKDNFWEMGETGPCGPCSEIHVDLTEDLSGGPLVNAGDPRVMEIWNLVFIQYNRDGSGNLTPLPAKHVDTGMGFERICAVLQKKKSNYDTDVFMPVIARISELANKQYKATLEEETDIAMRVIADHVRMLSFSIADGGIPSNEGRGYVMRRILRRAARFGRNLGMHEPFIYKVVQAVVDSMGEQYPEIKEKQSHIERVIKGEEESFNLTLDRGIELHSAEVERCKGSGVNVFSGDVAFKLHDTFGFPIDMTEMMAREVLLTVDSARFEVLMEEQRLRSKDRRSKFMVGFDFTSSEDSNTSMEVLFEKAKNSKFLYDHFSIVTKPIHLPFLYKDRN
jgi:alanyl-tRNA synthetase